MKDFQIQRNEIQILRNEIQARWNKSQIRRNEIQIQNPSISSAESSLIKVLRDACAISISPAGREASFARKWNPKINMSIQVELPGTEDPRNGRAIDPMSGKNASA